MELISYTVYGLKCPLINDIRYIGSTKAKIKCRYNQHLKDKGNSPKSLWIQHLKKVAKIPELIILKKGIDNICEARLLEKHLIKEYSLSGNLLNTYGNLEVILKNESEFTKNIFRKTKFKKSEVLKIRSLFDTQEYSIRKLAVKYGCTIPTISFIVKRQSWMHI